MGVLSRRRASATSVWRNPAAWRVDAFPRQTRSGEDVTPDAAMSLATYFACVAGIAEDVAGLPSAVVAAGEGYRRPLRDHPVTRLLSDAPNDEMSAFTFVETMQSWCDGWGNAYAEIQRNGAGQVVGLWPIHPSRVAVKREEKSGAVFYAVRADDVGGQVRPVRPASIFHLHGLGDGIEGKSVLAFRAESVGLALAAQGTAGAMFKNELMQSLTFAPTGVLDENVSKQLLGLLKAEYAGVKKAGGILATNVAGKFERIGINPDEAQALESRQFSVPDICRWFRRSPSKVGYTEQAKGWATREDEQADDVLQCLLPRVLRWEAEIRRKLLGFDSGLGFKMYLQGLLRASSEKRAAYYQSRLQSGSITPNEIRALEDEAPADDANADELLVNSTLVLLSGLGAKPPPPALPAAPFRAPPDDAPDAPDSPTDGPDAPAEPAAATVVVVGPPGPPDLEDRDPPSGPPPLDRRALARTAVEAPVRHVAARIVGKESAAVARALTKPTGGGPEWAARFYDGQRSMAGEEFAPLAATFAHVAGLDGAAAGRAVAGVVAGLWPDPVARSAEAYRTNEDVLAATLADQVLAALAAVEG